MRSGIVHHKSDRKSCVIPKADRNTIDSIGSDIQQSDHVYKCVIGTQYRMSQITPTSYDKAAHLPNLAG